MEAKLARFVPRLQADGERKKLYLLFVRDVQKGGTTALQYLGKHQTLCLPAQKAYMLYIYRQQIMDLETLTGWDFAAWCTEGEPQ